MNSNRLRFYILMLIIGGLIALFMGFASISLWLAVLLGFLLTRNREEVGIFLLLAGSAICGRMFAEQNMNTIFTVAMLVMGMLLLLPKIQSVILNQHRSYFYLLLLLVFFFIEYCFGGQSDYAKEKMMKLFVRSLIWLTCFLVHVNSTRVSNKDMAIMFLLLAMFYLSQSAVLYDVYPSSFKDFTFFRKEAELVGRNDYGTMIVNSHTMGYLGLFPLVLWMSDKSVSLRNKESLIIFILSFIFVIFSGTRQVLVSLVILMIVRIIIDSKRKKFTAIMLILLILVSVEFLLTNFGLDYFSTMLEGEEETSVRLHRDISTPLNVMTINPWLGVGFGNYPDYANNDYPHNLILEILCEMGVIGLVVFATIIFFFIFFNHNKKFLRYTTAHGSYFFLTFLVFLFRSLISGDLADSMSGICALLAIVYRLPDNELEELGK
ncbi:MAG: O-antigen ligase family protein [Bacteroidales bacterium]|jgi:O-antigen ligase|nr:O-antigen ligase family protein [Bacteroidales bacterium]